MVLFLQSPFSTPPEWRTGHLTLTGDPLGSAPQLGPGTSLLSASLASPFLCGHRKLSSLVARLSVVLLQRISDPVTYEPQS